MFTDLRHNPSHFTLIITVLSSRLSFLVTNRGLKYVCIVEVSVTDSFGWKSDALFCKQNQWAFFFCPFSLSCCGICWGISLRVEVLAPSFHVLLPSDTNLSLASTAFSLANLGLEGVNCTFSLFSIWRTALVEETLLSQVHTGHE